MSEAWDILVLKSFKWTSYSQIAIHKPFSCVVPPKLSRLGKSFQGRLVTNTVLH